MRLQRIFQIVLDETDVKEVDLLRLGRRHSFYRCLIVWLMMESTTASFSDIARILKRDPSTINRTYRAAQRHMEGDRRFQRLARKLTGVVQAEEADLGLGQIVLVGEHPEIEHQGPLYPGPNTVGEKLMSLMGFTRVEYLKFTRRVNLIPHRIVDRWPEKEAHAAAENLTEALTGYRFVLIGKRVCSAFQCDIPPLRWESSLNGKILYSNIPHPYETAWYADHGNVVNTRKFLRASISETKG